MHPSVRVPCVSTNQALQTGGLHYENPPSPSPEDQTSEVRGSQGWAPCRGSREGSFLPLPASGGSGHPSLGWWPPPSRLWLRLHVASPLCLPSSVSYKDLSWGLGSPSSRSPSSQALHFSTPAMALFPDKVLSRGSGGHDVCAGGTIYPARGASRKVSFSLNLGRRPRWLPRFRPAIWAPCETQTHRSSDGLGSLAAATEGMETTVKMTARASEETTSTASHRAMMRATASATTAHTAAAAQSHAHQQPSAHGPRVPRPRLCIPGRGQR